MSSETTGFTLLLTSAIEDSEVFLEDANVNELQVVHLPLEKYVLLETDRDELAAQIDAAENIIHGHKRNAQFFISRVEEFDLLESVTDRVNLAADQRTADFLEEHGVPAIYPGSEEPIKMLEFLMRLRRLGTVLFPCGTYGKEEIPGLLKEMDIEVNEKVLFELEGPKTEELESYQKRVIENHFDVIVYHSRRSVNRIQAAFPNLHETNAKIIAGDQAVTDKLAEDHDIEVDKTAEGSWESILEQVKEFM
ncbi:uroporphyrinogen-III synthase [Aliifodinibius sp. S!AR15-10]|uniref:uroporphyrinogen-III synthase n=1 Tax=Aliifodinibius sp. S!AR15-10 TaxID=2950437 RepID=UPI0028571A19|nr:uroporphyrinogen-III synthase [Aliifodinibius sp. S!AR15-10]MDR8392501.1 uroporphyrinogen-III synthase [Aliifodinibius sp. S!AR15-10]